jgi:hypothetical protein
MFSNLFHVKIDSNVESETLVMRVTCYDHLETWFSELNADL